MIHPTAVVDPEAHIDDHIDIGAYSVISANVYIGSGTVIGPHVVIQPFVEIQNDCRIFPYAAIGGIPQSAGFKGEETHVRIGRGNVIREYVTIHRGTEAGGGLTEIGEDGYFMAYCHIGHDCKVGSHANFVNCATLAGHVTVGDHVTLGGLAAIHQFVRVGDHAFIGGHSAIVMDIPPYVMAEGNRAKLHGLNSVGLRRSGFSSETISILKKAYRIVFRSGLTLEKGIDKVEAEIEMIPEVVNFSEFLKSSKRGITR